MMAPHDFESSWNKQEQKIVDSLVKFPWIKPLLLVAFLLFVFFTFELWTQSQFPNWSRFNLAQDRIWAFYVLVSFSFLPLFFKFLRKSPFFLLVAISCSWLFPVFRLGTLDWAATLPIIFLILSSLIVNLAQLKPNESLRWVKVAVILVLFLSMVTLLTHQSLQSHNNKTILYFSILHLDFLFIYFIGAIFNKTPFSFRTHFNPIQLVNPLPIPGSADDNLSDREYEVQFVRGALELIQAQIIFIAMILSYQTFYVKTTMNPLVHYALFVGAVVASMKSVTSLLCFYGIKSPSTTYFLALAKSPIEVWQRGSVFLSDFLFSKVYLPTWKRFRNNWLSSFLVVFAILFHMVLFHEFIIKSLLRLFFGNEYFGDYTFRDFRQQLLLIGIWLVWIGAFLIFQKFSSRLHKHKFFQWILILLTHMGSALIIPLVTYLGTIF